MKLRSFLPVLAALSLLTACASEESTNQPSLQLEENQNTGHSTDDYTEEADLEDGDGSQDQTDNDEANELTPDQTQINLTEVDINTDFHQMHQMIRNYDERYNFNYDYIKLDQEDGDLFYEVKTWDGAYHLVYHFDPGLNEITLETEENNIDQLGIVDIFNVLQADEAVQIALDNSEAEEAYRWILTTDQELDQPVYEIELESGLSRVNALDGSLLDVE